LNTGFTDITVKFMNLAGMEDPRMIGGKISVKTKRVECLLKLQCDWGGDSDLCCLVCPKMEDCKFACPYAIRWYEKGEICNESLEV
jgi:hypothetical protein